MIIMGWVYYFHPISHSRYLFWHQAHPRNNTLISIAVLVVMHTFLWAISTQLECSCSDAISYLGSLSAKASTKLTTSLCQGTFSMVSELALESPQYVTPYNSERQTIVPFELILRHTISIMCSLCCISFNMYQCRLQQ